MICGERAKGGNGRKEKSKSRKSFGKIKLMIYGDT